MNSITLRALERFPRELEAHYAAIPSEFRHWRPSSWEGVPSEQLTAIEQVRHVRDVEVLGYQVRLRRTAAESNPMLDSLDTDALARDREYANRNADAVLAEFRAARKHTIEFIAGLTHEQLRRTARFEGYGACTLQGLVHYLCSHDQQHLAGLQWLLGKIEAVRGI